LGNLQLTFNTVANHRVFHSFTRYLTAWLLDHIT
jgi:hypothetical protein